MVADLRMQQYDFGALNSVLSTGHIQKLFGISPGWMRSGSNGWPYNTYKFM